MEISEILEKAENSISRGIAYKRKGEFGSAINSCQEALAFLEPVIDSGIAGESELQELLYMKNKSLALIGQMQEILSFVNTDLMNP